MAAVVLARPVIGSDEHSSEVVFAWKVLPLLKTRCVGCHGEDPAKLQAEFDMRSRAGLLKGGESQQPSIVPGKPLQSPLYLAVTRKFTDDWPAMPPKDNDSLTADQMQDVKSWIASGAVWPDKRRLQALLQGENPFRRTQGVRVKTSGGLTPEWTNRAYESGNLWAYQPVERVDPPHAAANPIDAFIVARLPSGLTIAPVADRLTLARRVTFDVTGLPPTPQELDAFISDVRPGAFERLVDRLLDSPHYGEQMAVRWLDVARYADSAGFSNDFPRPNAWRYRDYVVRSFNNDKPYDRFIREQIAGDEIDPEDADHLIATGYLRMGPWEHTAMSVAAVTRQQFLDDVVNAVGVTFLAHELRCAKCHDHKFDPIPTRDYYRLQAVFSPVQFVDRALPYQPYENQKGMLEGRTRFESLLQNQGIRSVFTLPESERPVIAYDADSEKKGHDKVRKKQTQQVQHQLKRYRPLALSVYSGKDAKTSSHKIIHKLPSAKARKTAQADPIFILTGGAIEAPGERVQPGVLSFAAGSSRGSAVTQATEGRRRALADWIASADNPLTARVIVNRVWLWHFGRALAGNPNNFGAMGKKPTHPQLLDWLAATFVADGWSFKKLQRRILLSQTYRLSSNHPDAEQLAKLDPQRVSHAAFRPRRLTAEELRDAMLAISGELNRELGGIPVHPEINQEVAMQPRHIMGSVGPAYQADRLPAQRNRRTIYAERIRTLADPMLEVFNKPGPDLSCERRDSSTIAPQAFTLLNSPIIHARALALAARLEHENAGRVEAQLKGAFRLVYQRQPSEAETRACLTHLDRMTRLHAAQRPVNIEPPRYVIRQMVEEMTGRSFWWVEDLDIYSKGYVADLKPADVAPHTRALADVCLVLFNSNEFSYVY
jgi:hypothetical protein